MSNIPSDVIALAEACYENGTQSPSMEDLLKILTSVINRISCIVLFLDGLDEILEQERKAVFHTLREILAQSEPCRLKLFISSREDTTYLTQGPGLLNFKVRLAVSSVTADIDTFAKYAIRDLIERGELVIGRP
jgi:hypothetical protein